MYSLGDERVTALTQLLQGIKAVKLFGWESRFLEMVDEKRERQLQYMWKLFVAWIQVTIASSMAPMLVLVVIFIVYVNILGNKLSAEIAFTSISVFSLIRRVFENLPGFMNWVIGGYVSLGRIDAYLGQPHIQDLQSRIATHADWDSADIIREVHLGFEHADLEWERPSGSAKPNGDAPTGAEATSADSPDASESDTEQTPLLAADGVADSSHTQIELASASESTNISDEVIPRFSLKDINVRFPHGAL
ncbi:hypothetical protein EV174_006942, partial [Coemansia sp. RSA 2320]